jgi:hypothetical protein
LLLVSLSIWACGENDLCNSYPDRASIAGCKYTTGGGTAKTVSFGHFQKTSLGATVQQVPGHSRLYGVYFNGVTSWDSAVAEGFIYDNEAVTPSPVQS